MALPARQLEQRARLLEELSLLLKRAGHADFVFGPILRPTPAFFPDDWRPDLSGAQALLARLMAYARLHGLPTLLRDDADPTWAREVDVDALLHREAAAWFAGADASGTYLFGVKEQQLEHPETLAGIFAHETAHAWRFRHHLVRDAQDEEEGLTDLTTVFLGFGALTANIASLADEELARLGYLGTFALAFTLGVQLALREDPQEQREVEAALHPDQRIIVREVRALYTDREVLARELGLPPPAQWQRPPPLELPAPAVLTGKTKLGKDLVFRVRSPPYAAFAAASAFAGAVLAVAALTWWPLALPVVVTPLARAWKRDRCSGHDCGRVLPAGAATCPHCGGQVRGRIRSLTEREAAERATLESGGALSAQAKALAQSLLRGDD